MDKVISFGEALVDMLATAPPQYPSPAPEGFSVFPGGAPANVAAAIGKLGGRAHFAGKLGKDMFGDFMKYSLQEANVNTDYLLQTPDAKTALAFVALDHTGERSFEFYRHESADLQFTKDEFAPEWFEEASIFHFCSNTLTEANIREATLQGISQAKAAGSIISFDVNLRLNLWSASNANEALSRIWECVEQSDIIKVCTEELAFLCDGKTSEQTLDKMLSSGVSLVLVTDGGKGLRYYTSESTGAITPPKVTTIDSTAAGDAFVGGFLYSLAAHEAVVNGIKATAADTEKLEKSLNFACACGAYAVTQKGAFSSLPSLEAIVNFFDVQPA